MQAAVGLATQPHHKHECGGSCTGNKKELGRKTITEAISSAKHQQLLEEGLFLSERGWCGNSWNDEVAS